MKGKLSAAVAALVAVFALHAGTAGATVAATASGALQDLQAGAHGDVHINLDFNGVTFGTPSSNAKDLTLHLPAGLLGDPSDRTICTHAQFAGDISVTQSGCPDASQVGVVDINATLDNFTGPPGLPLQLTEANNSPAKIFLIEPRGGEPARLGIWIPTLIGAPLHVESPIRVRTTGDYGLDSVITNLPTKVVGANPPCDRGCTIYTQSMTIKLWGSPSKHSSMPKPFMVNPPACDPATAAADVTSYATPDDVRTTTFGLGTPTGCGSVPFNPGIGATPTLQADRPGAFDVAVAFPTPGPSALVQAHMRKAVVTLPEGIALSAGVAADGLDGCSNDAFGLGRDTDPSCPALSEIGDVSFVSPLIGALNGKVYLGMPEPGRQFRLLAYARKGDVRVKLVGVVTPDETTGRLTTVFDDLPRQPFSTFVLAFRGGDTAVLTAPQQCGTREAVADFVAYSGASTRTSTAITTTGCGDVGFAPSVSATPSPSLLGVDSRLSLTFDRPDGQARLKGLSLTLPPGQLGNLFAFPTCSLADARAARCSDVSRVGTATVTSGTGGRPFEVKGSIYLVEPYDGGVGGLAVVVPVKVGPLDLGTIVNLTKLRLRDGDLAIRAETEDLPQIISGIPLAIRTLRLDIDRDGFLVNGTSCDPHTFDVAFRSADGRTAGAQSWMHLNGCPAFPFKPTLSGTLTGDPRYPTLKVNIRSSRGQANLKVVTLALPNVLGINLPVVKGGCRQVDFDANRCPESSIVGTVKATSPLLKDPLAGPVRLVEAKGQQLPNLFLDLQGFVRVQLWAKNRFIDGHIVARVDDIPDVPISDFEMVLKDGANGLLAASSQQALCLDPPNVVATMIGQTGAEATSATTPALTCGPVVRKTTGTLKGFGRGRTPTLSLKVTGKNLRSLKVTLPKALKLDARRFAKGANGLVSGRSARSVRRSGSRVVTVTGWRAGSSIQLSLGKRALRRGSGLKIGKRLSVKLEARDAKGKKTTATVRLTPRR